MVKEVSSVVVVQREKKILIGEPQVGTGTTQFEGRLSAPANINVENTHDAWKSKYTSSIHAGIQMKGCNSRDGHSPRSK